MKIRVVLADDHAMVRDGLRALLESQPDIQVIAVAATGRGAVAAAQEHRPDIAVMDITMPELNGIDAAREIAAQSPNTRVLILTMHGTSEHVYRALKAGVRGYLLKDSAGALLVTAVREVHAGRRFLDHKVRVFAADTGEMSRTSPIETLSPRERTILQWVVEGRSNGEIAQQLSLSVKTVETYRSRMMQKLGISDLPSLVKFAIEHGLTALK